MELNERDPSIFWLCPVFIRTSLKISSFESSCRIGSDLLPHTRNDFYNGQSVVAYARPHETQILQEGPNLFGIKAKINRILKSGNTYRVELIANDPDHKDEKEYYEVEIGNEELNRLNLQDSQHVRLQCRQLSLFQNEI